MASSANSVLPLSMISPSMYAIPYTLAIIAIFVVILALLLKYKSLRNFGRKRNIIIYGAFILILGLLMFQADSVSRRALVGYGLSNRYDKAYSGQINEAIWSCTNHGGRSADFYLVINSVNASFTVQNQKDYFLVSNTTVKVPFSISEGSKEKSVFFTVENGATSFSFSTSTENRGYGGFDVNTAETHVVFVWNAIENYYILKYGAIINA